MNREFNFSGSKLRRARRSHGLSQTELANQAGLHRSTVVRWESNINPPDYHQVQTLGQLLGVPPESLYDDTPAPPTPQPPPPPEPEAELEPPPVPMTDPWIDQVPWERVQQLTAPALRSQRLTSKQLADRTGLPEQRLRDLINGRRPTREEIHILRQSLGNSFNPTPQLARPMFQTTFAPKTRSEPDKLDLILQKLARLESEVREIRDFLEISGFQD